MFGESSVLLPTRPFSDCLFDGTGNQNANIEGSYHDLLIHNDSLLPFRHSRAFLSCGSLYISSDMGHNFK